MFEHMPPSASHGLNAGEPIKEEKLFLTIDGYRYDVTNFVKKHPGGSVIRFYCADHLDATDAFMSFHARSERAQKFLNALPKEKVTEPDDGKDPLVRDFRALRQELQDEGAFKPLWGVQILRCLELIFIYVLSVFITNMGFWKIGGLIRALYLGRNGFVMHDAGHRGFGCHIWKDKVWHWFIFTVCLGGSGTFWTNQHNKHHAATQEMGHDIDLDTLPLVAFNEKIADLSGSKFLLRIQHLTFIPAQLLLFFFWKLLHIRHIFRTRHYAEGVGMILHHVLEWYFIRSQGLTCFLYFNAISWAFGGMYLATIFSLNHTHKPVAAKFAPRDWVRRAVLHTTNLPATPFVTWLNGYLNFQIEHHLFPTMPHPRLPYVRDRVKALLKKHNVLYDERSLGEGFQAVFSNLYEVGHPELAKSKKKL